LACRVRSDYVVEVEGNSYSVPWHLIGEQVRVTLGAGMVRLRYPWREVAVHTLLDGRRERAIDPTHFEGVAGFRGQAVVRAAGGVVGDGILTPTERPALLRPLAEYEAAVGGGW
jgi:hypothetical protein